MDNVFDPFSLPDFLFAALMKLKVDSSAIVLKILCMQVLVWTLAQPHKSSLQSCQMKWRYCVRQKTGLTGRGKRKQ